MASFPIRLEFIPQDMSKRVYDISRIVYKIPSGQIGKIYSFNECQWRADINDGTYSHYARVEAPKENATPQSSTVWIYRNSTHSWNKILLVPDWLVPQYCNVDGKEILYDSTFPPSEFPLLTSGPQYGVLVESWRKTILEIYRRTLRGEHRYLWHSHYALAKHLQLQKGYDQPLVAKLFGRDDNIILDMESSSHDIQIECITFVVAYLMGLLIRR